MNVNNMNIFRNALVKRLLMFAVSLYKAYNEVLNFFQYRAKSIKINGNHRCPLLINDCVQLNHLYIIFIDGLKFSSEKIKSVNLSEIECGWHKIEFVNRRTYTYYLNKIEHCPNVLISKKIVDYGRACRKSFLYRNYKNYIQNNYSVSNNSFGFYGKDYSACTFDKNGIPVVPVFGKLEYNYTSVAQYALSFYASKDLIKSNEKIKFLYLADYLCNCSDVEGGGYPARYDFIHRRVIYLHEPFFSAMTQGQILSVLARAFLLTGDEKYKISMDKIFKFMVSNCKTDLSQFTKSYPCLKEFKNNIIFEEFVHKTDSYVLNGDLFAIAGIHDYYEVTGNADAKLAFDAACESIKILLPYYDFYGISSYDLLHYVCGIPAFLKNPYAHDYHIAILDALYFWTKNDIFKEYSKRFISYYEDENYS